MALSTKFFGVLTVSMITLSEIWCADKTITPNQEVDTVAEEAFHCMAISVAKLFPNGSDATQLQSIKIGDDKIEVINNQSQNCSLLRI